MGKTKTKIIDDSLPVEEPTHPSFGGKKKSERRDDLVEKLKAELEVNDAPIIAIRQLAEKQSPEEEIATSPSAPRDDEKKKTQKPGKEKPRSKKYQEVSKDLDRTKTYPLTEAVDMVKKLNYAKFDATLEAHINTAQTGIRGLVSLPYAKGKKLRIVAFGKGADQSGADVFGDDSTIEEINEQSSRPSGTKGKVDFDLLITTPEWMPKLAKIARILGPRGLMPNPKNGTITTDLKKCVEGFQSGKTEYKTEAKASVIHLGLGKLAQPTEELSANIKTLLQVLGKSRVKKVSLSPTMGPSVKLDLSSI